jgi:cytoplasmic iron level regulating protein YaaA (DUF328/UPF0246 family)
MKILLAPSESKKVGGTGRLDIHSLLFEDLALCRNDLLDHYNTILQKSDIEVLSKMFGLKKESEILRYKRDIRQSPVMKAMVRYTGVAFDYLDYPNLDQEAQEYIDRHVILFSNLFGPIRADDTIPEYRLKQGEHVGEIQVEKYYRECAADLLESYLRDDEILDLRAGFYNKFYKPKRAYTTLKFIKNGKVVSHWAKAYRGIVLREIAKAGIETLEEFMSLEIENLAIEEIIEKKVHTEIIYQITDD